MKWKNVYQEVKQWLGKQVTNEGTTEFINEINTYVHIVIHFVDSFWNIISP